MMLVLGGILAAAVVTDLRSQRIPNVLTYSAWLLFTGWHLLQGGLDGLLFSLAGLGTGLGLMLIPYIMGVMGAGDVKLMAAVGAALGAGAGLWAFLFTSLLGGLYALVVLAGDSAALRAVTQNFMRACKVLTVTGRFSYESGNNGQGLPKLCYAVAIAAGTVASVIWRTAGI